MTVPVVLIIGANGQIGTELAGLLADQYGKPAVITSDVAPEGRVTERMFTGIHVIERSGCSSDGFFSASSRKPPGSAMR